MNAKTMLLLVGLVAGGLVGYLTRPQAAEIKIGPLSVEIQDNKSSAGAGGGDLTSGQVQHIGLYAVIGAVLGLGAGFVADRRRG
ncbi:hypothetical protein ASG40_16740 [Methylobacterium sp. Leaf399]|uniref:hypothetical protein n=1 Tax=unclassified Methylobacterium TaxID=2615210 RepID=UPI0006FFEC78|nr:MULTISPECIES: hypothetical protein [unclassified Methylobacterium]KQP59147.1 hypothetical protein ASF39_16955 [Methylobacterium sp. Leaf108]KQT18708.1 hypothetical protein ASG40_16740 [Methylobacterium sp. Leaf399]KQT88814.1 hypothetical protein ASG59_14580 [Methylobacterium sp. Leaf466]